ncbi:MAG: HAD family hydrolase [Dehalococcoidia bacterium]
MIRAIMFDLDGTLVQTEKLFAEASAIVVQHLRNLPEPDPRAIEAYRETVGTLEDVASRHIIDRLGLDFDLRPLVVRYGVSETWQVLLAMVKEIYEGMVADPQVIRDNQWPHTVGLLRVAKDNHCQTALATNSSRQEALQMLRALDLQQSLDLVLTREDVAHPKPDPEIYRVAAEKLEVPPEECLVIEDSTNGVRAGVAAGMNVIAFATPFTTAGLHANQVLEHAWVVHDPENLLEVVRERITEHNRMVH